MSALPSSKDVAREAGVSQSTVSFVLNDRTDISISSETRDRVKRIARRLGYLPNRLARSLVSGRTQTIGVLVPRLDSSFCGGIAQGIQVASCRHGYRVLIANTTQPNDEVSLELECMLEHQVDGILCVACESTQGKIRRWIEKCHRSQIPLVLIDDITHSDVSDCVVSDDLTGARVATRHLIKLGHSRIAHLAGSTRVSTGRERIDGYKAALREARIRFDPRLVIGQSYLQQEMEPVIADLLSGSRPPSAIFAANDVLAARALLAIRNLGLQGKKDISIVGYGNYAMGNFLELSTTDQLEIEMGVKAFERLLERIRTPELARTVFRLPTRLIVRASSKPCS